MGYCVYDIVICQVLSRHTGVCALQTNSALIVAERYGQGGSKETEKNKKDGALHWDRIRSLVAERYEAESQG